MNKKDIAWFIKHAVIAIPYIPGNEDQARYSKLLAAVRRALSKAAD